MNEKKAETIKKVIIDGEHLTINQILAVARHGAKVELHSSVLKKISPSRQYVETAVNNVTNPALSEKEKKNWLIYGVTTGFGCHKDYIIRNKEEAKTLQRNIILSHATGVGDYFDSEIVRALMLLRVNSFAKGHSGVRYELLELLVELLNNRIHPLIPEKGSVGSSGDLCPLAHMSLVFIDRGKARIDHLNENRDVWIEEKRVNGSEAMERMKDHLLNKGIPYPFELSYKEGLALTNGATVMTAVGVMTYYDALNMLKHADIAGACALEAIGGRSRAFDEKVHRARPFPSQIACADNIRRLVSQSTLIEKNNDVHDAYSVRCIPQVHGASKNSFDFVKSVLEIELNAATDNPLFFEPDPEPLDGFHTKWDYSAGNYHGQPIALAMDFLGLAISEIGNISERRIQKLLDIHHNYGLNSNLTVNPRLNSGFMLAQYSAASLASENKVLCHPASADSIPTSANIEDHVSMGTIAARKARSILENVKNIIAIELLCAAQALDFRMGNLKLIDKKTFRGNPGKGVITAYNITIVPVCSLDAKPGFVIFLSFIDPFRRAYPPVS